MHEAEDKVPEVYLNPGEVYFARSPAILKTLLGSCVGITFWSARKRIGALCHGVLPWRPADSAIAENYRYVDFAILDLLRRFEGDGVPRTELQVKVFGGADVLPVSAAKPGKPTVGFQNREAALKILRQEGIAVIASDVGGLVGRTIHFHTGTGEVLLKRLAGIDERESHRSGKSRRKTAH